MAQNYNDTIHKMQTPFEMRAGLPKKEPKMLEDWEQNHVYEQMIKNNEGKPQYILHDGPPYANGNIHMGTALNKIIKDIIIRYKNMSGFQAPYVPGYDTHGLPIELKALSSLGDKKAGVSKLELRQICKEFATEHIGVMNEQFKRLGVQGDFENPYLTLRPEFEARQVEIFGEMAKKGYIYKGMKAVYWCPEDRTALAEAEIEYAEDECDSIYVRFKLTDDPNGVLAKHNIPLDKAWIVIWTTTTWTLPANVATCLNPNLEYAFVKIGDAYHIMARELVESTMKGCHIDEYEVLPETVLGSELELMQYQHPFLDRKGLVILGDHVTLEGGTGCVHTAPGHGVEDFEVCVNHYPQVPVVVPVDDAGRLTAGKVVRRTGQVDILASHGVQRIANELVGQRQLRLRLFGAEQPAEPAASRGGLLAGGRMVVGRARLVRSAHGQRPGKPNRVGNAVSHQHGLLRQIRDVPPPLLQRER